MSTTYAVTHLTVRLCQALLVDARKSLIAEITASGGTMDSTSENQELLALVQQAEYEVQSLTGILTNTSEPTP